mmetsp:Transcript_14125/g.21343  ORF Transcript_14125/g.21343 Transcript_14125/m.21343 type:complete len:428 (-) Transcript_14125:62-1345(-)
MQQKENLIMKFVIDRFENLQEERVFVIVVVVVLIIMCLSLKRWLTKNLGREASRAGEALLRGKPHKSQTLTRALFLFFPYCQHIISDEEKKPCENVFAATTILTETSFLSLASRNVIEAMDFALCIFGPILFFLHHFSFDISYGELITIKLKSVWSFWLLTRFLLPTTLTGSDLANNLTLLIISEEEADSVAGLQIISVSLQAIVWLITTAVIANAFFEYDIGAFLSALGIGGIILGLALRRIMEDFLAGLVLILGHSWFKVGDTIQLNNGNLYIVEEIALTATRLIVYDDGSVLHISNNKLLADGLTNLSQRKSPRPIHIHFLISLDAKVENLDKFLLKLTSTALELPDISKHVQRSGSPPYYGAQFRTLTSQGFEIEFIFTMHNASDPDLYKTIQTKVHLAIIRLLQEHSLSLAYPRINFSVPSR